MSSEPWMALEDDEVCKECKTAIRQATVEACCRHLEERAVAADPHDVHDEFGTTVEWCVDKLRNLTKGKDDEQS